MFGRKILKVSNYDFLPAGAAEKHQTSSNDQTNKVNQTSTNLNNQIKKDKSEYLDNRWLFKGNQSQCNGKVSISEVEDIRSSLENLKSPGICFNKQKIGSSIDGGTCSAMSLGYINSYLKLKKIVSNYPDAEESIMKAMTCIAKKYASSSEEMRNIQAAFNTIEVIKSDKDNGIDYSKNKIQSLANFHQLKVDFSSKDLDVLSIVNKYIIKSELKKFPEGAFLVRIIKPSNNEKLEEFGHSMVYIKEGNVNLFYDPNSGLENLKSSDHSKVLFNSFKSCYSKFDISKIRFYQLNFEN